MQNIRKKNRSRILAGLLCIALLIGMMPFNAINAHAADGKITIRVGERIDYSSHFTHYFYAGDKESPVYCAQPQLPAPGSGTYSYSFLKPDSVLAKCLYYGYGGPGFSEYTDKTLSGQWDGKDDAYALTHIIISIAYDKTTSADVDPFRGLSGTWKTKAQNLYNYVKSLPDPPVNYRAYLIKVDGCQDLLGSFNDTGSIKLKKASVSGVVTDGNPNYSLAGAKYGVYYGSELIGTITTDSSGEGSLDNVLVANYTVKEIAPSKGYAIDVSGHNVSVKADTTVTVNVKEVPQVNPMDLVLQKLDLETGESSPQGGASLAGAEFTVDFYKAKAESSVSGMEPERSWTFKTDENGQIKFTKEYLVSGDDFYYANDGKTISLPLGKVVIKETKAPEGYLLSDAVYTVNITSEGTAETVRTYNAPDAPEQVKRGDLEFVKVSDGDLNRLANVPFKLTSLTTGESHILVTDKNGYASTSAEWNLHTANTNRGETAEDGIWFGTSAPDNSKGALIYDDYELEELRCEANKGMKLLKFKVSVYKDSVTIPLGTLTDDRIEIGTEALDEETGTHFGKAEETVIIVDTVSYEGLEKGKEYKLIGTLMDKETGEPIKQDGKAVTSETTFVARDESGKVSVEFEVEGKLLRGKAVVAFEKLYYEDIELAIHADIEDEDQSVYYPEIGTQAKDKESGLNKSIANEKVTIVDTVSYEGLQKGKIYTLKGTLMDKETEKPLLIGGEEITVVKKFKAEDISGEVSVEFAINASDLDGKEIVVFESLYKGDRELAVHADIEDEGQTIFFPEIGTTAKDGSDGDKILSSDGEVTIVDTVEYDGLIEGRSYTLKGTLMDKDTEKQVLIDGNAILAETTFIAEKASGSAEVTFRFSADSLKGKALVVFETLYYADSDIEVADHQDIEDEGQTVIVEKPVMPDTPKTGDDSNVWIWIALLVIASGTIAAVQIRKKNGQENTDDEE
ncbi:VaFE repeat-containing surface-anchored protein [Zhenpiania hominis]|uniref:VaFE repeat-containing surface-anchored protein n=1 Tax=Zhenpiania hominis TaxID=2763644 RepID=A0A923NGN4_9FIRM|nr:VaFE repeat-containing surface-anchored protein [Zhenpiania hominis]MBC6678646.1 VaFE repeat-containing surface-anchored protein [Zhenpiania hominis]